MPIAMFLMGRLRRTVVWSGLVLALPGLALADPCKAIPDRGALPAYLHKGSKFAGRVVYVGDGDSLCVAVGKGPANEVEVRLEDFYAPELHEPGGRKAKLALQHIARGRRVTCIAGHRTYDRVTAACEFGGRGLGARLRAAGITEGGRGVRKR